MDKSLDAFDHRVTVPNNVIARDAQYFVPLRMQKLVPNAIPGYPGFIHVRLAVDLNHQPPLHTTEIDRVRRDRKLASKFESP